MSRKRNQTRPLDIPTPEQLATWLSLQDTTATRRAAYARYVQMPCPTTADMPWQGMPPLSFSWGFSKPVSLQKQHPQIYTQVIMPDDELLLRPDSPWGLAHDPFGLIPLAAATTGTVIAVPSATRVQEPLLLQSVMPEKGLAIEHLYIVLGASAQATIIDKVSAERMQGAQALVRLVTIAVGPGADLTYYKAYTPPQTQIISTTVVMLEQQGLCRMMVTAEGGTPSYIGVKSILQGADTRFNATAVYTAASDQRLFYATHQRHDGPRSVSSWELKGALVGQAQGAHSGMVHMAAPSQDACAEQESSALLLSDAARAAAIPAIEVMHDRVQCTHGTAIGRLSLEALWYLQTRGIAHQDAKRLVLCGFFAPLTADLSGPLARQVRERISDMVVRISA